jgi:hypothetical protein
MGTRGTTTHPDAPLARGERVLTSARQADGTPVLATRLALYQLPTTGSDSWFRLGWEQIHRADWIDRRGVVLHGWMPEMPPQTVLSVPGAEPLLAFARERIGWTTLLTTRIPIGARGSARVAARREPGSGRLLWMVRLGPGVPDDDATRAQVSVALARLRADLAHGM